MAENKTVCLVVGANGKRITLRYFSDFPYNQANQNHTKFEFDVAFHDFLMKTII